MRLFFALLPPPPLVEAMEDLMHGVRGARWQTADQLHLTLRFVGEVPPREADDLAAALFDLPASLPPIALDGVGYFEANRRPNALWVRAAPRDPLHQLHKKIDRACQSVGLPAERRSFLPHITVARLPRDAGAIDGWIASNAGFSAGPACFLRCSLLESIQGSEKREYHEVASLPLR